MDIYSWNPESRTPFIPCKRLYGVCETVRVATLAPRGGSTGGVLPAKLNLWIRMYSESQCVEWVVKIKGMTESAKAYTFIVIGGRGLGCS